MKLVLRKACALLLLLLSLTSIAYSQTVDREQLENGSDRPWYLPDAPKAELELLKSRWRAIEREIAAKTDDVAGTYIRSGSSREPLC